MPLLLQGWWYFPVCIQLSAYYLKNELVHQLSDFPVPLPSNETVALEPEYCCREKPYPCAGCTLQRKCFVGFVACLLSNIPAAELVAVHCCQVRSNMFAGCTPHHTCLVSSAALDSPHAAAAAAAHHYCTHRVMK